MALAFLLTCFVSIEAVTNPLIQLSKQVGGRQPVMMPTIALGTGGYDNVSAADAVSKAFEVGLLHIHAAFDYYNLPGVAAGLQKYPGPRSDLFVTAMTTPCIHPAAPPVRNVTDPSSCFNLTVQEVEDTLSLLEQQYVDLLLLHGPSNPFGYEGGCNEEVCALNQAQFAAYATFLQDGRARAIGVSNFCQSCLECLQTTTPAVNQVQWHVGMGPDPEGLPSYCASKDIIIQAYSPLAAGEIINDPLTNQIADSINRSSAQVGLRWVVQIGSEKANTAMVVKADSVQYLKEDLDVFDWELAQVDVDKLSAATVPKGQQDGRPSWGCSE